MYILLQKRLEIHQRIYLAGKKHGRNEEKQRMIGRSLSVMRSHVRFFIDLSLSDTNMCASS